MPDASPCNADAGSEMEEGSCACVPSDIALVDLAFLVVAAIR